MKRSKELEWAQKIIDAIVESPMNESLQHRIAKVLRHFGNEQAKLSIRRIQGREKPMRDVKTPRPKIVRPGKGNEK